MSREIILFTQRVEIVASYGERRDCADQRTAKFIRACGYTPVPLPNDKQTVIEVVDLLHPIGFVLTGGNSLVKYGGHAPERDETDRVLIDRAVKYRIPLFGFCRGMQSILDYFGNELIEVTGHAAVRHRVSGTKGDLEVNSYHNQGCVELADDHLEVVLTAEDGVIEQVRHNRLPILGIMWHPERESGFRDFDITLCKNLMGGNETT